MYVLREVDGLEVADRMVWCCQGMTAERIHDKFLSGLSHTEAAHIPVYLQVDGGRGSVPVCVSVSAPACLCLYACACVGVGSCASSIF